mmetsp:Transcript_24984/g.57632  ORF Transcript_24984/g.57632 Transcript_24984/m.57632 type:complete len:354 (-) Transcript_24984:72-1133(-)|eukprot:CAMPEP_0169444158 /NCGR_PEP_ID=MMETSP1042-20121227/9750_1 /TAXON_ID=464988 /ORGANISM="Hemiselmis andersenii, Strain CCMP1180" /LENGTH=353 /DNA_ID=CAMNT_0009555455 /DNA_START=17 /DNA_END=1078 /DNA_ORIENTATION=-
MAVVSPLLGNRTPVRAAVVVTMAAGLLGLIAVTVSVGSAPSALVESRLHEWDAGREQGLPYKLRREEQLTDMRSEASRDGEMSYIFGKARAGRFQGLAEVPVARQQQLHEWDAGREQGLPYNLRRKEQLTDMRQQWSRDGEMNYIFGGKARAARMQGLAQYSWEGLNGDQQRALGDQEERAYVGDYNSLANIESSIAANAASNGRVAVVRPRMQALSQWGKGGLDWGLQRAEKLGYLHEANEDAYDSNNINGPLDEDLKKTGLGAVGQAGLKAQHLQMLHQSVMSAFSEAKRDPSKRAAFKQQLTMLCDEGRSHPQYWALKTELDKVDGGEDDSDTVDSFDDDGFGGDMDSSF